MKLLIPKLLFWHSWLVACIIVICLVELKGQNEQFTSYILNKRKFETYSIPTDKLSNPNFFLTPPGIVLMPLMNGIYIPHLNTWLTRVDSNLIWSACSNAINESLYMVLLNSRGTNLVKTSKADKTTSVEHLYHLGSGLFTVCSFVNNILLYGGKDSTYVVLTPGQHNLDTLYTRKVPVTGIAVMDENTILVSCTDGTLDLVQKGKPPFRLMDLDININGIDIARDGSIFLSTPLGIQRYYSMSDLADFDLITYYINGQISIFNSKLYVKSTQLNQFFIISL